MTLTKRIKVLLIALAAALVGIIVQGGLQAQEYLNALQQENQMQNARLQILETKPSPTASPSATVTPTRATRPLSTTAPVVTVEPTQ